MKMNYGFSSMVANKGSGEKRFSSKGSGGKKEKKKKEKCGVYQVKDFEPSYTPTLR